MDTYKDEHLLGQYIHIFLYCLTNKVCFLWDLNALCFNRNWLESCPLITLSCLMRSPHRSGDASEPLSDWMRVLFHKMARYRPQFLDGDYFNATDCYLSLYLASFKSYYLWWWNRSTYMENDFYKVRLTHISAFLACNHVVTPEMFVSRSLSCTRSRLIVPCSGRFMRQPESSPSRSTSANQWGKADCSSVNVKRRRWKSCRMQYWNTASTTAVSLHRPAILPDREVSQSILIWTTFCAL